MKLSKLGIFVILWGILMYYHKSSSFLKARILLSRYLFPYQITRILGMSPVKKKFNKCYQKMFKIDDIIELSGYYILSGTVLQPSVYLYFYKSENITDTKESYIRQHGKLIGVYGEETFRITFRTQGLTTIHFWAKSIHPECETKLTSIHVPPVSNCPVVGRIHNTRMKILDQHYYLDGKVTADDRELFYYVRESTYILEDPFDVYYYGASAGIIDNEFHLFIGKLSPGEYNIWIVLFDGSCISQSYNYKFEVPQCNVQGSKAIISSIQKLDATHARLFLTSSSPPHSSSPPTIYMVIEPKWMTAGRRTISYITEHGRSCVLRHEEDHCYLDEELKPGVDYFIWTVLKEKDCYSQEERSSFILRDDTNTVQTFITAPLIYTDPAKKAVVLVGSLYHMEQHNINEDIDFMITATLSAVHKNQETVLGSNLHVHVFFNPETSSYYYYFSVKDQLFKESTTIDYTINHHFLSYSQQSYALSPSQKCLSISFKTPFIQYLSANKIRIKGTITTITCDFFVLQSSHQLDDSILSLYSILQEGQFVATISQGPFTINGVLKETTNYIYIVEKYDSCLSPLRCYTYVNSQFVQCS